jgi:hypothetical protein
MMLYIWRRGAKSVEMGRAERIRRRWDERSGPGDEWRSGAEERGRSKVSLGLSLNTTFSYSN